EVVLPRLEREAPDQIIDALQHRMGEQAESLEDASLGYAFARLSERARRHLPFLGLFATHVDADTLGLFVERGDEQQEAYTALFGEALDAPGWEAVLEEAVRGGFLRSLGGRTCELHPTLPVFLRRQLGAVVGAEGIRRLDAEFLKFYAALAGHFDERVSK